MPDVLLPPERFAAVLSLGCVRAYGADPYGKSRLTQAMQTAMARQGWTPAMEGTVVVRPHAVGVEVVFYVAPEGMAGEPLTSETLQRAIGVARW